MLKDFEKVESFVDDLDEMIDRLVVSMDISYDKKMHDRVIEKYNATMDLMEESTLSSDEKDVFSELMKRSFEKMI